MVDNLNMAGSLMTEDQSAASRREELIREAAARCFARYGFSKATLDDIAAAVGIKKASLYYYFESKEAILRRVIEFEADHMLDSLQRSVDRHATVGDRLQEFARTRLEDIRKEMILHDMSVAVVLELKPLIDRIYGSLREGLERILAGVVEAGIRSGEVRPCDARHVAGLLMSVLEGLSMTAFQGAQVQAAAAIDYDRLERETAEIVELILAGIKAR
jgi:TetR/AcrR family transcriptional regulator